MNSQNSNKKWLYSEAVRSALLDSQRASIHVIDLKLRGISGAVSTASTRGKFSLRPWNQSLEVSKF